MIFIGCVLTIVQVFLVTGDTKIKKKQQSLKLIRKEIKEQYLLTR